MVVDGSGSTGSNGVVDGVVVEGVAADPGVVMPRKRGSVGLGAAVAAVGMAICRDRGWAVFLLLGLLELLLLLLLLGGFIGLLLHLLLLLLVSPLPAVVENVEGILAAEAAAARVDSVRLMTPEKLWLRCCCCCWWG